MIAAHKRYGKGVLYVIHRISKNERIQQKPLWAGRRSV